MKKFKITINIAWGDQLAEMREYKFYTEEEKDSFLRGANECMGWGDYAVIAEGHEFNNIAEFKARNQ